jgi:hypothetical protein
VTAHGVRAKQRLYYVGLPDQNLFKLQYNSSSSPRIVSDYVFPPLCVLSIVQVGVQTEIEPDAGANALEDRVNAVLPLANKDDDDDDDGE